MTPYGDSKSGCLQAFACLVIGLVCCFGDSKVPSAGTCVTCVMHYHVVHLEISNQPSNPATWCSSARVACFHPGRCREDPGPSLMRLGVGTLMSESTTVTRVPVISKCLSYISSANAFPAVDDEHGSFDIITASCKYARRPASLTAAHSLHIGRPAGSRSIGSGAPRRKPFSPS
jgi:hypothetical protein